MAPCNCTLLSHLRSGESAKICLCLRNLHFGVVLPRWMGPLRHTMMKEGQAHRQGTLKSYTLLECLRNLDGPNRQSPIASVQRTQPTLAGHSASPHGTNTTPMNANRAIRIAVPRTQGLCGPNSVFLGGDMTANER